MRTLVEDYDIVVVGAGHAGCEAALAGARLGLNTASVPAVQTSYILSHAPVLPED